MDDLFQFIIFVVIALVAIMGSTKKKAGTPARRPPPRPDPRRAPDAAGVGQERAAPSEREVVVQDLLDLLQGRAPAPRPAPPPEPLLEPTASLEVIEPEAQSIESLDPEGSPSHRVFHERYVDAGPVLEPPTQERVTAAGVRRLTPRTAREAVIWKAIFDKPKGLI